MTEEEMSENYKKWKDSEREEEGDMDFDDSDKIVFFAVREEKGKRECHQVRSRNINK